MGENLSEGDSMNRNVCPNCKKELPIVNISFRCQEVLTFEVEWPTGIIVIKTEDRSCSCGLTLTFKDTRIYEA